MIYIYIYIYIHTLILLTKYRHLGLNTLVHHKKKNEQTMRNPWVDHDSGAEEIDVVVCASLVDNVGKPDPGDRLDPVGLDPWTGATWFRKYSTGELT